MNKKKEAPDGIFFFLISIIVLDFFFLIYRGYSLLFVYNVYAMFLSVSLDSFVMWIDVLFALLALLIIPYGFVKRKKSVWIFAVVVLFYAVIRTLFYMVITGDKTIGYVFFAVVVVLLLYLFSTTVKEYFGNKTVNRVPDEIIKVYTYGLYTLYTELVHLKNGKNQIIYFFSKKIPKSGTPTTLPPGYHVEVSTRSGLPYLKKDPGIFST
jgi:lysylphosphatidylglycerol synthetase-like protein (DUF2156 family)